jgi:hypothetical protein
MNCRGERGLAWPSVLSFVVVGVVVQRGRNDHDVQVPSCLDRGSVSGCPSISASFTKERYSRVGVQRGTHPQLLSKRLRSCQQRRFGSPQTRRRKRRASRPRRLDFHKIPLFRVWVGMEVVTPPHIPLLVYSILARPIQAAND